jgi:hypothetical protein
VADQKLRDTGLHAVDLFHLLGATAFNAQAGSQQSLPTTTAAEAVTQHWLQALDHGHGTDTDASHPYKLFQGLAVARKALVQAHAAQGLAGLLQTCPATVAALQGVLPFMRPPHQLITQQPSLQEAPQQQQQQSNLSSSSNRSSSCTPSVAPNSAVRPAPVLQAPPGSSSSARIGQQLDGMVTAGQTSTKLSSLMELLPPGQQAWLMADVVAGLLLHQPADDSSSSSSSSDRHNNNSSNSCR